MASCLHAEVVGGFTKSIVTGFFYILITFSMFDSTIAVTFVILNLSLSPLLVLLGRFLGYNQINVMGEITAVK